jgi:hypothetical protein
VPGVCKKMVCLVSERMVTGIPLFATVIGELLFLIQPLAFKA